MDGGPALRGRRDVHAVPWNGDAFIALAVVAEMSSYISMGGGFVYALFCGPLLLVALVATAVR